MSKITQIILALAVLLAVIFVGLYFVIQSDNSKLRAQINPSLSSNSQPKNLLISSSSKVDSESSFKKSATKVIKFVNEGSLQKNVNEKSKEPLFWNGESQKEENAVYIIGVPGVTYYSDKNNVMNASIITKAQVEADISNEYQDMNKKIIANFDNIIAGKSNDIQDITTLYRTNVGGFIFNYGYDLKDFKLEGLDSQRAFLSLEGQSYPLVPNVNIVGKVGEQYLWIHQGLYDYETLQTDVLKKFENNNLSFEQMLDVYKNDPQTQKLIEPQMTKLIEIFEIAI
jgi:hypothetical protein